MSRSLVTKGIFEVTSVHYRISPHDGGWAYQLDGVFSEPFPTEAAARKAVQRVLAETRAPTDPAAIEYQDADGKWHVEISTGDNPEADLIT